MIEGIATRPLARQVKSAALAANPGAKCPIGLIETHYKPKPLGVTPEGSANVRVVCARLWLFVISR